ncbi:MAG: hypothetical protein ABSA50_08780 [Candidatus Bathyarchaeia archaeon]
MTENEKEMTSGADGAGAEGVGSGTKLALRSSGVRIPPRPPSQFHGLQNKT